MQIRAIGVFDGKKNPSGIKKGESFEEAMKNAIKNLELDDELAKKLLPGERNANAIKLKQEILSKFDEIFDLVPNPIARI